MIELLTIIIDIISPIFIIIGIGYLIQKNFSLDVQTLAKLNIYFLVPGFIFVKLYSTDFTAGLLVKVLLFFILYVLVLYAISLLAAKTLKLNNRKKTTFTNSVMFFNSGNYGVPVNDLVFNSDPLAMSIQVIVLTLQNIFLFSYGIFSLQSLSKGRLRALLGYFKMPVLYAMLSGVAFNLLSVPIPSFVWVPANYIADAMIALALLTLGAQVAQIKIKSALSSVWISLFIRLVTGPIIALAIIYVFRMDGITAQALLIASAMPTSVNSAVIAQEYNNYPGLAAQVVLFSTLFSTMTVTIVIYLARILF